MFQRGLTPPDPFGERSPLEDARTQDGMSLKTMADMGRVVVVFLPALGSPFCRELLTRVRTQRPDLEHSGVRLVLVHMGDDDEARAELERFDLHYLARVADAERLLHGHFELGEASAVQRLRPTVIGRAIGAARYGRGPLIGSAKQLHGAVLLDCALDPRLLRPTAPGEPLDLVALIG